MDSNILSVESIIELCFTFSHDKTPRARIMLSGECAGLTRAVKRCVCWPIRNRQHISTNEMDGGLLSHK